MAGTLIHGDLSVKTDSLETEALLVFIPQEGGREWNAESIVKYLGEERITPLPSTRALEETLQKWSKIGERANVLIARGTPPQEATPEEVKWQVGAIPEDLTALAQETIERAKAPEIWKTVTSRVKRESIVKKPAALPFLPPKEERITSWEQTEKKEAVYVDAKVLESRWTPAGESIGAIMAAKPGKSGKSVFGQNIQPDLGADTGFHTGQYIRRERNELFAEKEGIVRIGKNWADILPLARHRLEFGRGSDGITPVARFIRGDRRIAPPDPTAVLEEAAGAVENEEELVIREELEREITNAMRGSEDLVIIPLLKPREALAEVRIEEGGLKATLNLRKALAGHPPLELKAISAAIKESGVRGFKAEEVKTAILDFMKSERLELYNYVLVEGRPPTRGEDRTASLSAAFVPEAKKATLIERIKTLDAQEAHEEPPFAPHMDCQFAPVQQGQKVIDLGPPSPGTPGMDVRGQVLPGIPGNDPELKLGEGLRLVRNEVVTEREGLFIVEAAEQTVRARIVPYRDAEVQVKVSQDGMKAWLVLERGEGAGLPLSREEIDIHLKEAGVIAGLDEDIMQQALAIARRDGKTEAILIAKGTSPVAGGSTTLTWLVERASGKAVVLDESGRADFKNQDRFSSVKEGVPLAEIIKEGDDGKPGFDVRGRELAPQKGTSVELDHDESIREEAIPGGIRLIAARTGELVYDGKSLKISAIHAIKGDIGTGTGNVKFTGEVRVTGSVKAGFAVVGEGDVLIGETVEAALVSAGGKIIITQGVVGAGKAIIRARQTIEAGFVEQSTLLAVEDIRIKNGCLLSNVKTNGKLWLVGEKGHLIGGICRARSGVECANLGSERGARTEISFGQDYLIQDQIEVTERELEKLKAALADLDKKLKALEGQSSPALNAARAEKVRLMKLTEKYGMHLFTLREKFEEHHESGILVRGAVFPGVVMESHGRYYEVKQKKTQLAFVFDRELGRIQENPLKNS